jgi:hypothetical protein
MSVNQITTSNLATSGRHKQGQALCYEALERLNQYLIRDAERRNAEHAACSSKKRGDPDWELLRTC